MKILLNSLAPSRYLRVGSGNARLAHSMLDKSASVSTELDSRRRGLQNMSKSVGEYLLDV